MNRLYIQDTRTGETRESKWQPEPTDEFYWTEGNASCDCNRAIAYGFDLSDDFPCGDYRFELVNEDGSPYIWPPINEEC